MVGRPRPAIAPLIGTVLIAFLRADDECTFHAVVQGLHVGCTTGAATALMEPAPDGEGDPTLDVLEAAAAQRHALVGGTPSPGRIVMWPMRELPAGVVVPIQLWYRCGAADVLITADEEWYLPTEPVAIQSRPWKPADSPEGWEVDIENNAGADGDDWVLLDVVAERIDDQTIRVILIDSGDVVGTFGRDDTPPEERALCG